MDPDNGGVRSTHFTLRAHISEAGGLVDMLWECAKKCGFLSVSDLIHLQNEQCEVLEDDPLRGLKVRARGFDQIGEIAFSYQPKEFWGFSCDLQNGEVLYIGLSILPDEVEVSPGFVFQTGLSQTAQWMSFVDATDCPQVEALLGHAESLGLQVHVSDPSGSWARRGVETPC